MPTKRKQLKKGGKRTANEIKDFLEASYQEDPPENLDGWILDKDLTTETAKVYYNPQTNEAVVAHRGTKGSLDWGNNLAYALGYYDYTPRYKEGKAVQDLAEEKYGKQNISTLGHSQGAILSRKLGADTKEVINVNPAWMGEKPYKNEYNIRSDADVVSGLYAPISYARSVLYPMYTLKHDILVPSENKTDILGEHSYKVLERLGNQEIGVGAENKISTNNTMKGGKKVGLDKKIKQLIYIGMPQEAVALLLQTGNLETIWSAYTSGNDIKPLLTQVLSSLEPRKSKKAMFDLNAYDGGTLGADEDPLQEAEVSEPVSLDADDADDMEGGMRHFPYAHANVGKNPIGVIGGARRGVNLNDLRRLHQKMDSTISYAQINQIDLPDEYYEEYNELDNFYHEIMDTISNEKLEDDDDADLDEQNYTMDDIKAGNPELLRQISKTIVRLDKFIRELDNFLGISALGLNGGSSNNRSQNFTDEELDFLHSELQSYIKTFAECDTPEEVYHIRDQALEQLDDNSGYDWRSRNVIDRELKRILRMTADDRIREMEPEEPTRGANLVGNPNYDIDEGTGAFTEDEVPVAVPVTKGQKLFKKEDEFFGKGRRRGGAVSKDEMGKKESTDDSKTRRVPQVGVIPFDEEDFRIRELERTINEYIMWLRTQTLERGAETLISDLISLVPHLNHPHVEEDAFQLMEDLDSMVIPQGAGRMRGGASQSYIREVIENIRTMNQSLPEEVWSLLDKLEDELRDVRYFPHIPELQETVNETFRLLINICNRTGVKYERNYPPEKRGGKKKISLKSVGKSLSKAFKPVSDAGDKALNALTDIGAKASSATVGKVFGDEGIQQTGTALGDVTNNYLLPAVVSAGKPIYDATAITASTMLTGNPVLGKAVADTLWNEMVGKQGYDPRDRQKSQELGEISGTLGQTISKPYSASLGGKRKQIDFEDMRWGTFEKMFQKFKRENPRARVKDLDAFAKRILKNKSKFSKRAVQKAQFYINVIEKK